jgi:hypothetical protein
METNLREDLARVEWISLKCKSEQYAQNLYAALCNNVFNKESVEWSCSWRLAGEIVAELSKNGSYLDWYCSGIEPKTGFVEEGQVTAEVVNDLLNLGWSVKGGES